MPAPYKRLILVLLCTTLSVIAKPRLHRCGNMMCDPEGNRVQLRGVSLGDLHYTDINRTPALHYADLQSATPGDDIRAAIRLASDGVTKGFNARVIRLPIHPDNDHNATGGGWTTIPKWSDEPTAWDALIDIAVQECTEQDVYCILDLHFVHNWKDPQVGGTAVPGTMKDVAIAFWERYGPLYKDNPNILFELVNEPISNNGNNKCCGDMRWTTFQDDVMTDLLHQIRVTLNITKTVLIVGTPSWSQKVGEVHSGNDYNLYDPIMYTLHLYPGHTSNPEVYTGNADDTYPIFMTEWGYQSYTDASMATPTGCPMNSCSDGSLKNVMTYRNGLLNWMENSLRKVSWTAWAFDNTFSSVMWKDNAFSQLAYDMNGNYGFQGYYMKNTLDTKKDLDQPCGPCDMVPPTAPKNMRVTNTTQKKAMLKWDAATDDIGVSEYRIFKNGTYVKTVSGLVTGTTIKGLTSGTQYSFTVKAVDASGKVSVPSNAITAYTTLLLKAQNAQLYGLGRKNATGTCPYFSTKQTTQSSIGDRAQWSNTFMAAGTYAVTVHWASAATTNRKFQLKFGSYPFKTWSDMTPTGGTAQFANATATIKVAATGYKQIKLITKNGGVSVCSVKFDPLY